MTDVPSKNLKNELSDIRIILVLDVPKISFGGWLRIDLSWAPIEKKI